MGIAPGLNSDTARRLRELNPHFVARWNRVFNRWDIWYESSGKRPYIVTSVCDDTGGYLPINGLVYSHLRKTLWLNQEIMRNLRQRERLDKQARETADLREQNTIRDSVADNRRAFQMLARERGDVSGKSKIPYSPGYGAGSRAL